MSELQNRLNATISKWIARAKELEMEAEALGSSENADMMASVINSKMTRARMYRVCANEVAQEAGIALPRQGDR